MSEIGWQAVHRKPEQAEKADRMLFSMMLRDFPRAHHVDPIAVERDASRRCWIRTLTADDD
jgi:hypothetical protein